MYTYETKKNAIPVLAKTRLFFWFCNICKTNYTLNHSTKLGLKRAGGDWEWVLILSSMTSLQFE